MIGKLLIAILLAGGIFAYTSLDTSQQDEIKEQLGSIVGDIKEKANETIQDKMEEIEFEEDNPSLNKIGMPIKEEINMIEFPCTSNEECNTYIDECNNQCVCLESSGECWK